MSQPNPIRAYRLRHNLSLEQLAEKLGTTKGNLSRVERGLQIVSRDLLIGLRRLGISTPKIAARLDPELGDVFGVRSKPKATASAA